MHTKDMTEFRRWAACVASGEVCPPANEISRVVNGLLDEIEQLHNRYAHEGGKPQLLTLETLIAWIEALAVPTMENVYTIRTIPNAFTADFASPLEARHCRQMQMLGLKVVDTEYPEIGRGRYMLLWQPPSAEERP